MTTAEIRRDFLKFFEAKGCKLCPSSSLVPDDVADNVTYVILGHRVLHRLPT